MTGTSAKSAQTENRLARSTSPYLRQHASNPVDWYPWGPEALERAEREDKPILLSVGYSACHWCHVMAHESFEDPGTAALMNERFVNIKVDREERPDIDAIYQKVVQLMGQGGGWPLTVFLTPRQEPFYGGTYFPKTPMYGRPSFGQILLALSEAWRDRRDEIEQQTRAFERGLQGIARAVDEASSQAAGAPRPEEPAALRLAAERLLERMDEVWGGFGDAPKFPNPTALEVLVRVARGDDSDPVVTGTRHQLRTTLDKMFRGGIYDHLRGGFARYSVDRKWLVPHFEKMLYDNAQLLPVYAEAAVMWPDAGHLRDVAVQTIDYLEADIRTPEGVFHAATDADSEGVEGKYYCWTPEEVKTVLGDETLAERFCAVYGVSEEGNFEHGWSILHLPRTIDERADALGVSQDELERRLETARTRLLEHRYTRVPPLRDDKVLTAWNALLVSGLCRASAAARAWGDETRAGHWSALASQAGTRLVDEHVDERARVRRAAFEGRVHTRGYLDDVACLGRACLDLHELTLDRGWLDYAGQLATHALGHYAREDGDGFYLTADDSEVLIERTESTFDGPTPSGLGVVVELLLRLDASAWAPEGARTTAMAVLDRFRGAASRPFGFASLLTASAFASSEAAHVTVRGPSAEDPAVVAMAERVRTARLGRPYAVSLSFEPADSAEATICRARVCTAPISDPDAMLAEL